MVSFGIIFYVQIRHPKLPAYLISVAVSILMVVILMVFGVEVDTIGSRFGGIPHFLPAPKIPRFIVSSSCYCVVSEAVYVTLSPLSKLSHLRYKVQGLPGHPNIAIKVMDTAHYTTENVVIWPVGCAAKGASGYKEPTPYVATGCFLTDNA